MIYRLRKHDPPPRLDHFLLFLTYLKEIERDCDVTIPMDDFTDSFLSFLSLADLSDLSNDVMCSIAALVLHLTQVFPDRAVSLAEALLQTAHEMFSLRGRNSFSASLFAVFAAPDCPDVIRRSFDRFTAEWEIGVLGGAATAAELISSAPLLGMLAERGRLGGADLLRLWRLAASAPAACDAFASVVARAPRAPFLAFLGAAPGAAFLPLLVRVLADRSCVRDGEFTLALLRALVALGGESGGGAEAVRALCAPSFSYAVRDSLFELCADAVRTRGCLFAAQVLGMLLDGDPQFDGRTDAHFVWLLSDVLRRSPNKAPILDLYLALVKRGRIAEINEDFVACLEENADFQATWTLLARVSHGCFTDAARDRLRKFVSANFRATQPTAEFVKFVAVLAQAVNVDNGRICRDRQEVWVVEVPIDLDVALFYVLEAATDSGIAEDAARAIRELYRPGDFVNLLGSICKRFLEFLTGAASERYLRRIAELLRLYARENDVRWHDPEHHGCFPARPTRGRYVSLSLPENRREPNFLIDLSAPLSDILIRIGPSLRRSAYRYVLYHHGMIVRHGDLCEIDSLEVAEGGNPQLETIAEVLVELGIVRILLRILESKRSDELVNEVQELLDYLPHDGRFVELSASPPQFCEALLKTDSSAELRYELEVLAWRVKSPIYRDEYRGERLLKVLFALLKEKREAASQIVQVMKACELPVGAQIALALLPLLRSPEIGDPLKKEIADYLEVFCEPALLMNIGPIMPLLEDVLLSMSADVWRYGFRDFVWRIEDRQPLFEAAVHNSENLIFREIFDRLLPLVIESFSPEGQLAELVRMLREKLGDNISATLRDCVLTHHDSYSDASDEMQQIFAFLSTEVLSSQVKSELYDVCLILSRQSPGNTKTLSAFISRICSVSIGNRWNVASSDEFRPLAGMRNLGATCYLNAVFQQIFRIPAFQYRLSHYPAGDDPVIRELQVMLDSLLFSKRRRVDTEPFARCWRGWDRRPIVRTDQQDANEFVSYFLDQLPAPLTDLFHGEYVHTIATNERDISRNVEPFWSLSLTVDGISELQNSLALLSAVQPLVGRNQYTMADGQKVDASKSQQIQTLPRVLIMHLGRFRIDDRTLLRHKITTYFRFPQFVDLRQYVAEPQPSQYQLHGVVLHEGDAMAGHYSSIVKIGERWMRFNDLQVLDSSLTELEVDSFGGDVAATSAYLLFYTRIGALENEIPILGEFELNSESESRIAIENDNTLFALEQLAFCDSLANIILEVSEFDELRNFFFEIFVHSRMTRLSIHFIDKLIDRCPDFAVFLHWLLENFDAKVIPVYSLCPLPEIPSALSHLFLRLAEMVPADISINLFSRFVEALDICRERSRVLPEVSKLIYGYLRLSGDHVLHGRLRNWVGLCLDFVLSYFDGKSDTFRENADLSYLFQSIELMMDLSQRSELSLLPDILPDVKFSAKHYQQFKDLLIKGVDMEIYDFHDIAEKLPLEFTNAQKIDHEFKKITADTFPTIITNLRNLYFVPESEICTALIARISDLSECLLSNCSTILEWSSNSLTTDTAIEMLLRKLCEANPRPVFDQLQAHLQTHAHVSPGFLRVLLLALQTIDYPTADLLPGLRNRPPSAELRALFVYFGDVDGLVEEFLRLQTPNRSSHDFWQSFAGLAPSLETAPTAFIERVFDSAAWTDLLRSHVRNLWGTDVSLAERCLKALIARRQSHLNIQKMVIVLMTSSNDEWWKTVAKYFPQLVDDLTAADVSALHRTLCSRVVGSPSATLLSNASRDIYIRGILKFVEEHEVVEDLKFDEATLIYYLKRCQTWERESLFIHYIVTVYSLSADSGRGFVDRIVTELRSVWQQSHVIILACCGLSIALRCLKNVDCFVNLHEFATQTIVKNSGALARAELAKCYRDLFLHDQRLVESGIPFLLGLIEGSRLPFAKEESELFEQCLKQLPEERVADCIEKCCRLLQPYTHNSVPTAPVPAMKVALLIKALPERRREIIEKCDPNVLKTFPRKLQPWEDIVSVLSPNV